MDALTESMLLVYLALVLCAGLLRGSRARRLAGAGLCLAGLASAADRVGDPGGIFTTTNEILLALGGVVVLAACLLGRRWQERPALAASAPIRLDGLLLVGFLLAAVGPHLILLAAGTLLCVVSAAVKARRHALWFAVLSLAAVVLLSVLVLLMAAMGPLGGAMANLASGPISPRAERALGGLVGAAALLLSGVPPLHRSPWGSSLAPLAAVMLARVAVPALALGLGDWQVIVMLALAVALLWAAWHGSGDALLLCGGFFALWSAVPAGVLPGCILVLAGWLRAQGIPPFRGGLRWISIPVVVGGAAGVYGLEASLRAQVLVSVVAVFGLGVGFLWGLRRDAIFTPPSPG